MGESIRISADRGIDFVEVDDKLYPVGTQLDDVPEEHVEILRESPHVRSVRSAQPSSSGSKGSSDKGNDKKGGGEPGYAGSSAEPPANPEG